MTRAPGTTARWRPSTTMTSGSSLRIDAPGSHRIYAQPSLAARGFSTAAVRASAIGAGDRAYLAWAIGCLMAGSGAMQAPDEMPGVENVHAAWRMGVGRRAAGVYAGNPNLAALAVAGSVGAGIADQFSDLELDCYWARPPTEADRLAPVRALSGELTALWEYDADEKEWSEDYLVGGLGVTVSNFLVGSVEQFLDDVLLRASTDPVRHMRLAALQRCRPLAGTEMMASWRARADAFPRTLVSALVQQALDPEVLTGWPARQALVSRGDGLAVRDLLARTGHAAVRVILALNRVYLPHRQLKWQRQLTTGLGLVPDRLAERLESMSNGPPGEALQAAEALLTQIVTLAEAHSDADIAAFREALAQRRQPLDPPRPRT